MYVYSVLSAYYMSVFKQQDFLSHMVNLTRPRRAVIIGLDGASADLVEKFMSNGIMPNLSKLRRRGVFARALPTIPTHTPTNWTTISTGAWPGTHGITGFSILTKGKSYYKRKSGFDTREVNAEFLWQAAERSGKRCILLKWAGPQLPVTLKRGIQIDGCFCVYCIHEISGPKMYSSLDEAHAVKVEIRAASGWSDLPQSYSTPLETELVLGSSKAKCILHVLMVDSRGQGYDKVVISKSKDVRDSIAILSVKEWSKWMRLMFEGKEGEIEGTVRLKLIELSRDGKRLRIYCSQIMPVKGWSYPEDVAEELVENVGPFLQRVGYIQEGEIYGAWADYETFIEELKYQHYWLAKAARFLMGKYKWDLFFVHTHAPDYVLDSVIRRAEPLTTSEEESREYMDLIVKTFKIVDDMIGEIIDEVLDDKTLIVVVSDHGVIGYRGTASATEVVKRILVEKGYLVYKERASLGPATKPQRVMELIDWSRTKAIVHDDVYIYINLKGREPHGVVEPKEYERVRDEIIETLLSYRDPVLKVCPFSLVLRAEDAEIIGLYGDRIGDIVFTVREGGLYNEGHGIYLPTAKFGMSSLYAFLIMVGPGLKEGYEPRRPIWLTDIAPTIAFLMGFSPPKNSEGAILLSAFTEEFLRKVFSSNIIT